MMMMMMMMIIIIIIIIFSVYGFVLVGQKIIITRPIYVVNQKNKTPYSCL